jgi:phosphatidylinositol glycan class B
MFYSAPVAYLEKVFPYPPVPLHEITRIHPSPDLPSHVILFGSLLDEVEVLESGEMRTVRTALSELGYREIWKRWNGVDWAQDESKRRGGVRIWRKLLSSEAELKARWS